MKKKKGEIAANISSWEAGLEEIFKLDILSEFNDDEHDPLIINDTVFGKLNFNFSTPEFLEKNVDFFRLAKINPITYYRDSYHNYFDLLEVCDKAIPVNVVCMIMNICRCSKSETMAVYLRCKGFGIIDIKNRRDWDTKKFIQESRKLPSIILIRKSNLFPRVPSGKISVYQYTYGTIINLSFYVAIEGERPPWNINKFPLLSEGEFTLVTITMHNSHEQRVLRITNSSGYPAYTVEKDILLT